VEGPLYHLNSWIQSSSPPHPAFYYKTLLFCKFSLPRVVNELKILTHVEKCKKDLYLLPKFGFCLTFWRIFGVWPMVIFVNLLLKWNFTENAWIGIPKTSWHSLGKGPLRLNWGRVKRTTKLIIFSFFIRKVFPDWSQPRIFLFLFIYFLSLYCWATVASQSFLS